MHQPTLMLSNHIYVDFETNFVTMHFCKKGKYVDALEEYEIYKAAKINRGCVLNNMLAFSSNVLYDTAIRVRGQQ